MAGKLMAHVGAQSMDREGLKALETPQPTDSWTPIPHYDLVQALEGQLLARGITIVKEQFAVQQAKLFGVIDTDYQVTDEGGAALGIRTSNDKSLALQLAIGYRVFVCDNMAFAGDLIALRRKHTGNLDLHKEFAEGIGRYVRDYRRLQDSACHLPSQRGQRHTAPHFLCNLLRTKAEEKILTAGMGFVLSWSGDRTPVMLTHSPGQATVPRRALCSGRDTLARLARRWRRKTCDHQAKEEMS